MNKTKNEIIGELLRLDNITAQEAITLLTPKIEYVYLPNYNYYSSYNPWINPYPCNPPSCPWWTYTTNGTGRTFTLNSTLTSTDSACCNQGYKTY